MPVTTASRQRTLLPVPAPDDQLTAEEFLAFTATRPDDERWELIEGVPELNASPVNVHQIIVANLTTRLMLHKERLNASWIPSPGIGTIVPASPRSLPRPDLFVQEGPATWEHTTADALVIFEVLSRSNRKADRAWRRRVYASVPNCQHYVTVSLKAAGVTCHDRSRSWKARTLKGLAASLDLTALDVSIPLAEIYRYTPLGA
jgi:Uma2 family endonuclease